MRPKWYQLAERRKKSKEEPIREDRVPWEPSRLGAISFDFELLGEGSGGRGGGEMTVRTDKEGNPIFLAPPGGIQGRKPQRQYLTRLLTPLGWGWRITKNAQLITKHAKLTSLDTLFYR